MKPLVVFLSLPLLLCSLALCPAADPTRPPNILFLFADDLSYQALGAYGNSEAQTPNLDKLAKRGATFTHAYNMGSWSPAVCVASRTMLITGRHVWDANRVFNKTDKERQQEVLWPQLLAKAGYDTYFTGKWHIQTDAEKCFRIAKNVRAGMPKTTKEAYDRPRDNAPDTWSPFDESLGGYWQGGKHWSEVVADDAVDFLNQAQERPNPFFMYIAFNAPHDPRQSPEEFVKKFPPDKLKVPVSYLPEYPHKEMMGAGKGLRDEQLAPFPRTEHAVQIHRGEYYALLAHLDVQVGRVLDSLEKSGQLANTWVFFTADHGLAVGHHGLMGKQNQYDHSVRVPFLVAGPGVTAGKKIAVPIYLQDVVPTTLELAKAEKPKHVWFQSVLPLVRGERETSSYAAIYGSYLDQQRAITADGFKLIVYPRGNVQKLFDLQRDPEEMHDLAQDKSHQATLEKLNAQLVQLQLELTDPLMIKK